jgi:succinate dehydrogenase / fumarate reductase flavoprotein subunit
VGDTRPPDNIPEEERDYYLERKYPSFGNLAPRDIASRAAMEVCDEGYGIGTSGRGVYLDFKDALCRIGQNVIQERYGNLFDLYERITGEDAYKQPMRIYPAPHYSMGGLWVDYNLESNIRGLFVLGEANFSDHGSNRLGASALMQGLADGYFIVPHTIADYLARTEPGKAGTDHPEFQGSKEMIEAQMKKFLSINGRKTVNDFHRQLGKIMWDHVGMERSEDGLKKALELIPELRAEFWENVTVPGSGSDLNQELEKAGRVADFLEFGELMAHDALHRNESCGGHLRVEYETDEGEAQRDDDHFCHVAAWESKGEGKRPELHKESLIFENVQLTVRSYT